MKTASAQPTRGVNAGLCSRAPPAAPPAAHTGGGAGGAGRGEPQDVANAFANAMVSRDRSVPRRLHNLKARAVRFRTLHNVWRRGGSVS